MSKKLTTEEFIIKAKEIHGDKYDYTKAVYITSKTKVTIICPIHGEFEQRANAHTVSKQGCPKCGVEVVRNQKFYSLEKFVLKSLEVHGTQYDYSNTKYTSTEIKVNIICKLHGSFSITPNAHLQGQGCSACGIINRANKQRLTFECFKQKANKIHDNQYTYDKVNYVNNNTKVIITCPVHGDFKQVPNSHLAGNGCPNCAEHGFNPNRPAILYYLKVTTKDNQILYKIGITNNSVEDRFTAKDLHNIEVLETIKYSIGAEAYAKEQELLKKYKFFQYVGEKVLVSHGNTELFTLDVLNLKCFIKMDLIDTL